MSGVMCGFSCLPPQCVMSDLGRIILYAHWLTNADEISMAPNDKAFFHTQYYCSSSVGAILVS